jgi:hypothetical protein
MKGDIFMDMLVMGSFIGFFGGVLVAALCFANKNSDNAQK